ncbi:pyrimidine utilization protein D [Serratia inhibens]|uniref:Putative carbamate hydrolase RutD n=1 Tax=Serratia inhibens TaxID=2338073 RepID=A0AA92X6M5_9GAMM|nr:pyrimidine utilization protein D [Serratia inhibens]ANS42270.1 Putative aminoacrylate hydrolase RutD [Serratia inhibens PRI-2C]RJF58191.1 pyrimidine utilization protein D [Serratia inhibens]
MYFEILGKDTPLAPTLVLSAGLGGAGSFWQPQIDALSEHFRVVVYDHHGTARSKGEVPAGYSMADMADEVAQLLRSIGVERCYFVGHALGGMIGLQLALNHPQLVEKLVVVNGWPALDSQTRRCFKVRQDLLLNSGVEAYVRAQPLFLFPADWLSRHEALLDEELAHQVAHFQGTENLLRRLNALMNTDFRPHLADISTPTLALCSRDDLLVPYHCSHQLAESLPFGELAQMAYGGHAMSVTDADNFNRILLGWLLNPHGLSSACSPADAQFEPAGQKH